MRLDSSILSDIRRLQALSCTQLAAQGRLTNPALIPLVRVAQHYCQEGINTTDPATTKRSLALLERLHQVITPLSLLTSDPVLMRALPPDVGVVTASAVLDPLLLIDLLGVMSPAPAQALGVSQRAIDEVRFYTLLNGGINAVNARLNELLTDWRAGTKGGESAKKECITLLYSAIAVCPHLFDAVEVTLHGRVVVPKDTRPSPRALPIVQRLAAGESVTCTLPLPYVPAEQGGAVFCLRGKTQTVALHDSASSAIALGSHMVVDVTNIKHIALRREERYDVALLDPVEFHRDMTPVEHYLRYRGFLTVDSSRISVSTAPYLAGFRVQYAADGTPTLLERVVHNRTMHEFSYTGRDIITRLATIVS